VKIGRVVFELCERTDRQTNNSILITILRTPPGAQKALNPIKMIITTIMKRRGGEERGRGWLEWEVCTTVNCPAAWLHHRKHAVTIVDDCLFECWCDI